MIQYRIRFIFEDDVHPNTTGIAGGWFNNTQTTTSDINDAYRGLERAYKQLPKEYELSIEEFE